MPYHANFPWLTPSTFKNEEGPFHSEVPLIEGNLHFLLNSSIPFYLPISYHRSNVQTPDSGRHFAHAAQFILHNEVHGMSFWAAMDRLLLENKELPTNSGFLDDQKKQEIFSKGVDECRNANEYIFEPRILMQLPYFPSVFYQWLCAFVVEWLQIRKKLSFIGLDLFPASCLPAVAELRKLMHNADRFAFCGFGILGQQLKEYPERSHELIGFIKSHFVPKVGYFKDFFEKRDFLDGVILSVRRQVLARYGKEGFLGISIRDERYAKDLATMKLVSTYYQGNYYRNGMFNNKEIDSFAPILRLINIESSSELYFNWIPNPMQDVKVLFCSQVIWNKQLYVSFLKKHILDAKIINGLSLSDLLNGPEFECIVANIEEIVLLKNYFVEHGVSKNGHSSEMSNILYQSRIQFLMNGIIGKVFQFQLIQQRKVEFNISENVQSSFGLPDSICILKEATSKPHFQLDELVNTAKKNHLDQKASTTKTAPDKNYFEKQAAEFMDRIQTLIGKIFETNANRFGLQFVGQHNLLWIQYILPCFVSSLLSARRMQKFKAENLNKLVAFINDFIGLFEKDLTDSLYKRVECSDCFLQKMKQTEILQTLWQDVHYEVNLYIFDRVTHDASFEGIPGFSELENIFTSFLYNENAIHPYFCVIKNNWALRQQWFLKRILRSVRNLEFQSVTAKNLSTLLKIQNHLTTILYKALNLPVLAHWLLSNTHRKISSLKRKQPLKGIDKNYAPLKQKVLMEAEHFSLRKTFGIVLLILVELAKQNLISTIENESLDEETEKILKIFRDKNWASLRVFLLPSLSGNCRNDLTLLGLDELRHHIVTQSIRNRISKDRVIMKYMGEVTMVPLKHCRCCGVLETAETPLQMCYWCKEFEDYPDVTWYCSQDCEEKCNDKVHKDEHENFVISLLRY